MSIDFTAREYKPGDEHRLVELLEIVFDGWPPFDLSCSNVDHWRWKFLDNPLKSSFVTYVEHDGLIVGMQHALDQRVKIGGEMYVCRNGMDVGTHPDFRRMGVTKVNSKLRGKLLDERGRATHFGISLTGNPILKRKNLQGGAKILQYNLVIYAKIKDINYHMEHNELKNKMVKKYGYKALQILNKISQVKLFGHKRRDISYKLKEVKKFDDEINIFWESIKDDYDFIHEKRKNHLNWRYCDPRAGNFTVIQAEDDKILGFVVVKINKINPQYPIGTIVEILTPPDRLDVASCLIDESERYFEEYKVNQINYWVLEKHPLERLIRRHGFINTRSRTDVFFGVKRNPHIWDYVSILPAEKIHYQIGDTDWV